MVQFKYIVAQNPWLIIRHTGMYEVKQQLCTAFPTESDVTLSEMLCFTGIGQESRRLMGNVVDIMEKFHVPI